mgnify:FL=1
MSEWNWSAERRTAIGDVANQSLEYVAERLLESRKRAFEAERKAQALQTELDSLKAAHAWIKTSERLPADDARVLALVVDGTGTKQIEIVEFLSRGPEFLFADGNETKIVTWWMPLPEPPK